ncbi:IMPACT family protein [Pseudomonas putida]|uniref:IMPACT family protein n=1 Tax=Pseudomonas putida TaxID=303 RepID=UPI0023649955|nr:YigZ family protein [Pseudomonas putida]MDD1968464.1 IMPACT family protein [Pseudomonas putida]
MPSTLVGPCEFREEIRKSRFITLAAPINTPAEAQAFIEQNSDLNATHNCWAWKLGAQYRSTDDGEPGGTAGRPILAAIEAQDFDQVVVLVIRWYGGIQLGTGGLARAYGGGANKCLQQAPRSPLIDRVSLEFDCSFSELALVKLRLAELNGLVEQETFTATGVDLVVALGPEQIETFQRQLSDISRGRIVLQRPGGA